MTDFPLRYAHENVLIGNDDARAALYRLETVSYPFLPEEEQVRWFKRLARFAYAIEADFSLYRVSRAYPAARYAEEGAGMVDVRHQSAAAWQAHLVGHEEHMRGLHSYVPEVYLAVALQRDRWSPTLAAGALRLSSRVTRAAGGAVRSHSRRPITKAEVAALVTERDRTLMRAEGYLPIRNAKTRELQWLIRRAGCRGVCEPMIDEHWQPPALTVYGDVESIQDDYAHDRISLEELERRIAEAIVGYEPIRASVERHGLYPILEQDRRLVVDADEGRSYQALLTFGALPEEYQFPGAAEFLSVPLEALPFPVDAVMHVRWIDNRTALGLVRRRVLDADNAYAEQAQSEHGVLAYSVAENRQLARDLLAYLMSPAHPPLLVTATSLAVGASSPEELDGRVEALRRQYGSVTLHRPLGLQRQLFLEHLPRADAAENGSARLYEDWMTVEQFGGMMPIGTHTAGSRVGFYMGHTTGGIKRPVRFDITAAAREHDSPSILMVGSLGSGKTITAEVLAYQAERRGSLIIDVDPKRDHHLEDLPELAGRVHVIELSGDERYRGLLDPLVVAPDGMREDMAASYLMDLLPRNAPALWETQIRKAVRAQMGLPERGSLHVLEALARSTDPHARDAAAALEVWADSGLGRLAFGDGASSVDHVAKPVTSIKARNLQLPDADTPRSEYTQIERVSVATMSLVAAFASHALSGDPSVHKVMLFDEAWALLISGIGRRLLDRLNRQGRSENATLILATQKMVDASDAEALVGMRMVFKLKTREEARRGLEILGLDPDDRALQDRVRNYRQGRCLMRDTSDRVAEVQIDPVYPHLLDVLDTSPDARARRERIA